MFRVVFSFLALFCIFFINIFSLHASPLAPADYQPHLMKSEFYSEQWSLSLWADDGTYVHVQFVISNIGLGDHKAAVKVELTWPDGRQEGAYEKLKDNWKSSKEGFRLEFGSNLFSKSATCFEVSAGNEKIRVDLKSSSHAEGWRPGNSGAFLRNKEGVYDIMLLAPYMKAEGNLVVSGTSRNIKGTGYIDHSYSDIAPHKLAKRWLKMKFHLEDGSLLLFGGLALPDSKKDLDNSWIWFGKDSRTVFAAANPVIKFADIKADESGGGYSLPEKIHLRAESSEKTFGMDLKRKALISRKSMLENVSKIERMVVERFANPIDYKIDGEYFIQCKKKNASENDTASIRHKGRHIYIMQYLNN